MGIMQLCSCSVLAMGRHGLPSAILQRLLIPPARSREVGRPCSPGTVTLDTYNPCLSWQGQLLWLGVLLPASGAKWGSRLLAGACWPHRIPVGP